MQRTLSRTPRTKLSYTRLLLTLLA